MSKYTTKQLKKIFAPLAKKQQQLREKSSNVNKSRGSNRPGKKEVLDTIKDYYAGLKMSENIRKIPLNMNKYWKRDQQLYSSDIKEIYDKYGIAYYKNKAEFDSAKEVYDLTTSQKEELWNDYQYRHKLIISGQYEDYRINVFKENYIKGMRRLGASETEIDVLSKLTTSQWEFLATLPDANKNNIKDKRLPPLGLFNYDDKSYLAKVREDLSILLKEQFDVEYKYDDEDVLIKHIKKLWNIIEPEDKDDIIESTNEEEVYVDLIRHVPFYKLKETKPDKYGRTHYYIRGVGSEKGKNSKLITDILKQYKVR